ncbi:MAG: glycosyltransferase family 9 protein [Thermodesulfobacteriota bacterium]
MKKILVIKMSALGDVVRTTPHIQAVADQSPDAEVWLLTERGQAGLFAHHPRISTALIDRSQWFSEQSVRGRIAWMRRMAFDMVIDFQGNRTSRRLAAGAGGAVTVGPDPGSVYQKHTARSYTYTDDCLVNFIDYMDEILVAGGFRKAEPRTHFFVSEKEREKVADFRRKHGLADRGYAVMHAGSSADYPSKRWPRENFARLAAAVETAGVRCVWVGGPDDREVSGWLSQTAGLDATCAFSPIELYEFAKGARFGVCADSGPMYLSAAAGAPVFALFGPTSRIRAHVQGQLDRAFQHPVPCGPCFRKRCPEKYGHACMRGLLPDTVLEKVAELLPERGTEGR